MAEKTFRVEKTFIESVDRFLKTKNGVKKSWIYSSILLLMSLITFSISLIFIYGKFDEQLAIIFERNRTYIDAASYLTFTGFILMFAPVIWLFSSWMTGVNGVSSDKSFHIFMWVVYLIGLLIAICVVILMIRASFFPYFT